MLLKFVGCMILAAIIQFILWLATVKFFEWRFFKKTNAILMLYDTIYPLIEDNFNNDNLLKVGIKFEYFGCKIKFRNALEASLKIEILIQKALKNYYIVKYLIEGMEEGTEELELEDWKKQLEEVCYEMRNLTNNHAQEGQKEEL